MDLKKQSVVGKWRLEKELGAGGQGVVWRVRYQAEAHSPPGAMKICLDKSAKARSRFEREVALLRDQNHQGIVRVRDDGEYQGAPYFVMELATTTLARVAAAESTGTRLLGQSVGLLLRLFRQACEAVAHLHEEGIVHRDIKPSNVLLMLDPPEPLRAVVADLGIAAATEEIGVLTATHEVVGTPAFRAPETYAGRYTPRGDVYSLGRTLAAVLDRTVPQSIVPSPLRRDQRLTGDLWDALDAFISRACSFDPQARFADCGEMVSALPEAVLGLGDSAAPSVREQRATTIRLSQAECVALAGIVSACPGSGERTLLHEVREKSHLNDYRFAISVRRLEEVEFIETQEISDYDGNRDTYVAVTAEGFRWAHGNSEEVEAAVRAVAPFDDDNIPF